MSKKLSADIWPQERDFMERPDRYRYVRKLIKPKGCVFCTRVKGKPAFSNLVIAKTKSSVVMLNKYPYNNGHLLILPQRHKASLLDLTDAEYDDLSGLLQASIQAIHKAYKIKGMNIGMNHGEVAGAGIPAHLHWHVIPRWLGDTNFFPLIGETKVLAETLQQSYNRLKKCFKDIH